MNTCLTTPFSEVAFLEWIQQALRPLDRHLQVETLSPLGQADRTVRCHLSSSPFSTAIAKVYPPEQSQEEALLGIGFELAGLQFLGELDGLLFRTPRLYAYDPDRRWVLLEDLGDHHASDLLTSPYKRQEATSWLLQLSSGLGSLHRHTVQKEHRFQEILKATLASLGLTAYHDTVAKKDSQAFSDLLALCEKSSLPQEIVHLLEKTLRPLHKTALYRSYCLKDPKIDHLLLLPSKPGLLDFEACYFHPLGIANFYRLTNGHFLGGTVPFGFFLEMEHAFRQEILKAHPEMASQEAFDQIPARLLAVRFALFLLKDLPRLEQLPPTTLTKWAATFAYVEKLLPGRSALSIFAPLLDYSQHALYEACPDILPPARLRAFGEPLDRRQLVQESEKALSQAFGEPVFLNAAQTLATTPKVTLRWQLESTAAFLPRASCIMKIFPMDADTYPSYVPQTALFRPFACELLGLAWKKPPLKTVRFPELYGVLDRHYTLLLEDLGENSLLSLASCSEPTKVRSYLFSIAQGLGELARGSLGRYHELAGFYEELHVPTRWQEATATQVPTYFDLDTAPFFAVCQELGIFLPPKAFDEAHALHERLLCQEEAIYSPTDLRMANMFLQDKQLCLIDLESARFAHRAVHHLCRLLFFPFELGQIPRPIFHEMQALYEAEVSKRLTPPLKDPSSIRSDSYAYHLIHSFPSDWRRAYLCDRHFLQGTHRQYSMERIRLFIELSTDVDALEGLHEGAKNIISYLNCCWGNRGRPPYLNCLE